MTSEEMAEINDRVRWQDIDDGTVKMIAARIIEQAADDYRAAKKKGDEKTKSKITKFFESEWCDCLVETMPFIFTTTGKDILQALDIWNSLDRLKRKTIKESFKKFCQIC